MLADAGRPPIDKACGEGLMPEGVIALQSLGVSLSSARAFPFRGIRFLGTAGAVDASFPANSGLGVRRTELHRLLVERAAEAGVVMLWDTPVRNLSAEGIVLTGGQIRSRWVIGADGQNSLVRLWAGLHPLRSGRSRFGFRRHYRIAPWSDCVELHWGSGCQIYVTPVAPDEVSVAVITRESALRLDRVLPAFPDLLRRLGDAPFSTIERGAVTLSRRLPAVFRGRVALIGDASGSVDAITGEGLSLAFSQALALAGALEKDDLPAYEVLHRRLMRRPASMANLLLLLDRSPWLRDRALRALAAQPALFATLVAIHVGNLPPVGFGLGGLLTLGREIFTS